MLVGKYQGIIQVANFKKLFDDSEKAPSEGLYKGQRVFCSDKFPVSNRDTLIFSIEKTKSNYPQGFSLGVPDGYIKVNGKPNSGRRKYTNNLFWEDSEILDVSCIEVQVFTKNDHIFIKNIWEEKIYEEEATTVYEDMRMETYMRKYPEGKPVSCYVGSGQWAMGNCNGAAMYSEDIPNGKRYFCNDGDEDDDFDDIIFTVTRTD